MPDHMWQQTTPRVIREPPYGFVSGESGRLSIRPLISELSSVKYPLSFGRPQRSLFAPGAFGSTRTLIRLIAKGANHGVSQ